MFDFLKKVTAHVHNNGDRPALKDVQQIFSEINILKDELAEIQNALKILEDPSKAKYHRRVASTLNQRWMKIETILKDGLSIAKQEEKKEGLPKGVWFSWKRDPKLFLSAEGHLGDRLYHREFQGFYLSAHVEDDVVAIQVGAGSSGFRSTNELLFSLDREGKKIVRRAHRKKTGQTTIYFKMSEFENTKIYLPQLYMVWFTISTKF